MTLIREQEETITPRKMRQRAIDISSVSSMEEKEIHLMTSETRDKITEKIQLIGQKIETLFAN